MMPSFLSLIGLTTAIMVYGKSRHRTPSVFVAVLIAALIQTAVTYYDLHTMQIPTP